MSTLQDVISGSLSLTRAQLTADKALVIEAQIKLNALGFYPGGQWIDGDLGKPRSNSLSWLGLKEFCTSVGTVSLPSETLAINADIAKKLVETSQIVSILEQAKNSAAIFKKLDKIQKNSLTQFPNVEAVSFLQRTYSPFTKEINNYPAYLEKKPDGSSVVSYGNSFTLSTGATLTFSNYPNRGIKPTIDETGLNFLSSNISHACVCVGSFTDSGSPIKTHWLGKKSSEPVTLWWSTTKFVGVLNTVCQINSKFPGTDVDDCIIESPRNRFNDLVKDMVNYRGKSSNAIGALFKSFTKREDLSEWIKDQTGNRTIDFRGSYGEDPLISTAKIKDTTTGDIVLSSTNVGAATKTNSISAYDLVRLISMLGWHLHLPSTAKLPGAQWKSLESVVRAMGNDTARYVDVALETLGIVNVISEPVIISKVGWGDSSMTYAALVKFVDRRMTPSKLRTFALALRCPTPNDNKSRDTHLAAAVTEIVRRIINEELA